MPFHCNFRARGYGTGTLSGLGMELTPVFLWPLILHQRHPFTLKIVQVKHWPELMSFENKIIIIVKKKKTKGSCEPTRECRSE